MDPNDPFGHNLEGDEINPIFLPQQLINIEDSLFELYELGYALSMSPIRYADSIILGNDGLYTAEELWRRDRPSLFRTTLNREEIRNEINIILETLEDRYYDAAERSETYRGSLIVIYESLITDFIRRERARLRAGAGAGAGLVQPPQPQPPQPQPPPDTTTDDIAARFLELALAEESVEDSIASRIMRLGEL